MKKRYNVSKDDYEWLQYNALIEISNKLTNITNCLTKTDSTREAEVQKCTACNANMIWATLTHKWICIECGNVLNIDDLITSRGNGN